LAGTPVASFGFPSRIPLILHSSTDSLHRRHLPPLMRLCKIALLAAAAFHLLLVVFNNLVDYVSNYRFVQHVMGMDTLFSGEAQTWRAIRSPVPEAGSSGLFHAAYLLIIACEGIACILISWGTVRLWRLRKATSGTLMRRSLSPQRGSRCPCSFGSSPSSASEANGSSCGNRSPGTVSTQQRDCSPPRVSFCSFSINGMRIPDRLFILAQQSAIRAFPVQSRGAPA
jgi:hypothetical protein